MTDRRVVVTRSPAAPSSRARMSVALATILAAVPAVVPGAILAAAPPVAPGVILAAAPPAVPGAAQAPSWPSFRGPGATGVAEGSSVPVEWDVGAGRNIRWRTEIPGYSHSSPIIWGERVFVVTTIGEDPAADGRRQGVSNNAIDDLAPREWKIYAVGRADGAIAWERTAHTGVPRVRRHEKGSHANSTPATDGRYVVAVFNSEGVFCWTVDGQLVWSKDLGRLDPGYWGQPDNNWGHASSPIIFEGLVIVQSDDFADSFVAAYRPGGPYTSTPLAYGSLLYVTRDNGVFSAYTLGEGELVYQQRLGTGFSASAVAADGKICAASEDGDVYVVAAGRDFELLARNEMGEPLFATPAISGDLLVVRTRAELFGIASGGS